MLLALLILISFFILALHTNINYEVTSGGFAGRILSFINFNRYNSNYNLFSLNIDNLFYTNNLQSIANDLSGLTYLFMILSEITGISPQQLMFVPYGVVFTSFSYYLLYYKIFKNSDVAFLSFIYILFYTITSPDQLGGYVAAWTYLLFSLFILINFRLLDKKRAEFIIVMFFLYLGLHFYWHTMEARALFFILSLNIVIYVSKIMKYDSDRIPPNTFSIFLAMFIVTIFFKEMLYKNTGYFSQISIDTFFRSYFEWFQIMGAKIGISSIPIQIESSFYYVPISKLSEISTYAGLVLTFIILFPIVISCIIDLKYILKGGYRIQNKLSYLKWSLLLSQCILMVTYGLAGGAGPGIILHFFPLATVIGFLELHYYFINSRLKYNRLYEKLTIISKMSDSHISMEPFIKCFFILIIVLNVIYCVPYLEKNYKPSSITYKDSLASSWFASNIELSNYLTPLTLTDFTTAGKFLVLCSNQGVLFNYKSFSPLQYKVFDDEISPQFDWNYMLINVKLINNPIMTDQGWNRLEPLSYHIDEIESNKNLNKIYNDNLFVFYSLRNW